jgi:predicted P-loop ATPase/GTPase
MAKLYVGFDDIDDARKLGNGDILFDCLKSYIQNEGNVVIEQRFDNAAPTFIGEFDSVEKLTSWLTSKH